MRKEYRRKHGNLAYILHPQYSGDRRTTKFRAFLWEAVLPWTCAIAFCFVVGAIRLYI